MIAEFIGTLTIIIAVWTWRTDRRSWMKKLGIAALGTVILQGVLGGITVLELLPPAVSTAHAIVGQTFFCIAVAIALFTGRRFVQEEPRTARDSRRPSLIALTNLSVFIVYVQLALGGMFRHKGMSWEPHVINAALVTFILIWTSVRVLSYYSEIEGLRRPAILVLSLVIVQLCLGFTVLPDESRLGSTSCAAHAADGFFHRGTHRRWSAAAGLHGRSRHPGSTSPCGSSTSTPSAPERGGP